MGRVTDELVKTIKRQVDEKGVVVWYDPEQKYEQVVQGLELENTTLAQFSGSYFRLRHDIDQYLEGDRPRLVVYVPLSPEQARQPLTELVAAGVEMYPGASRPCNTRLSVVAKPLFDEVAWTSIGKGVDSGAIGLIDLDRLVERPAGMLSLIFGGAAPEVIALAFVSSGEKDTLIAQKDAHTELKRVLEEHFGFKPPEENAPLDVVRGGFARHVLTTELVAVLPGPLPTALEGVPVAGSPQTQDACTQLCRTWRVRSDLADSYSTAAARVEQELHLGSLSFSRDQLQATGAFLPLEEKLQESVERQLRAGADLTAVEVARERQNGFWSRQHPDVGARWVLVATAGELLLTAERIGLELKKAPQTASALLAAYATGERPWYLLDTYQRRLETLAYSFDWDEEHEALNELRHHAANKFAEVGGTLAEVFVRAYKTSGYSIAGLKRQRDVFRTYVAPALALGKTAYVMVDALRFEMAMELVSGLGNTLEASLDYVLGSVPSITEIGMAALLPRADGDVELVDAGAGKLALRIAGVLLKDRAERMKFLKETAGASVTEVKLEDLLANKKAIVTAMAAADLVVVTSQEIDLLCEQGNIALARNTMDTVVRDLRRAMNLMARQGVQTIIVTADHGYLFGEEAGTDMTIDAPGGETIDLHRRVWIGHGGAAHDSCVRMKASDLGWGGTLEIVAPWNMACFKSGGAKAYFHGGLAPQEIVVPVAVLRVSEYASRPVETTFAWNLTTGAKTISTRFLSVKIEGRAIQLFDAAAPRIRVEVRTGTSVVSTPLTADYGLDEGTGDVALRVGEESHTISPNIVVLQLHESIAQAESASVHLLDAATGLELKRIASIPVRISL